MPVTAARHVPLPLGFLAALAAAALCAQTPLVEQGRAAIQRGDSDAAIDILEKAVAQSPQSAEAHFCLANAYGTKLQQSGMLAAARYAPKMKGEFEKAVALDPKHVEARFGLVEIYAMLPGILGGSKDKAFEQAAGIKAIDPLMGHRAYAFIYAQQKKLDLAAKEYAEALREQPNSPKAHSYHGQYLVNVAQDYTAAFAEFEMALQLDPGYMPAFYYLGRAAALANAHLARGEEALKKYVAYTPKENEPALANARYFLGAVYEKEGKKEEAKRSYQAALALNPNLKQASDALKRGS